MENGKLSKIRHSHLVKQLILRRLALFDCTLLQNGTSQQPSRICRFFTQNGEAWRHQNDIFLKKYLDDFFENLMKDANLMVEKVGT